MQRASSARSAVNCFELRGKSGRKEWGKREREKEMGNVVRESVSPRSLDIRSSFYRLLLLALLMTM